MTTGPPSKSIEQKRVQSKPVVKKNDEGTCMWKSGDRNTKEMYKNRKLSEEFEKHQREIDEIDMKEESDNELIVDGYESEQPDLFAKELQMKEQQIWVETVEQKVVKKEKAKKPLDARAEAQKANNAFQKYHIQKKKKKFITDEEQLTLNKKLLDIKMKLKHKHEARLAKGDYIL